jgi:hypothetical protein
MPGIGDPVGASIRSTVNSGSPVTGASRDDLQSGDVVGLYAADAASTYAWAFLYKPDGSTADFTGSATDRDPGTFTVDLPGAYLVQLTVNVGTAYESSQAVRLRRLTDLGQKFSAAGEYKRDSSAIPVDAGTYGWTDDLNANLSLLEASITSGSQGPQGAQGAPGSQGPQGDAGTQGTQGAQGDTGSQGPQGDMGNQGPQGDAGSQGHQGDMGAQGFQGVQGSQGTSFTYASGIVGSNTTVTLDALNFQLPSSGNFSLQVAAVSGSLTLDWSSLGIRNTSITAVTYYTLPPGNPEITTSWSYIDSGLHLINIGMSQTVLLHDRTNNRAYRVHAMTGPSFANNLISVERLV